MSNMSNDVGGSNEPLALFSGSLFSTLLRLGGLILIDGFALWFIAQLLGNGAAIIALTVFIITFGLNIIFLFERFYPFRWLSPGLALIVLMVIYPALVTVYYAFTNYSTGNLLRENIAIQRIQEKPEYQYLEPGEEYYDQITYGADGNEYPDAKDFEDNNEYLLWLQGRDTGNIFLVESTAEDVRPLADWLADGEIFSLDGFQFVPPDEVSQVLENRPSLTYDAPLGEIVFDSVQREAEGGEGVIFDLQAGVLADYTGNRPTFYQAYVYQNADDIALWLVDDDETLLALPEGTVTEGEIPETILGYARLAGTERTRPIVAQGLPERRFGAEDDPIRVDINSATRAGRFASRYEYNDSEGVMIDRITQARYEPIEGTFTLIDGSIPSDADYPEDILIPEELTPGYFVVIGFDNFTRLFTDERLRGPFLQIFLWTIVHAAGSVFITFTLGLALAILLDDERIPYRKVLRSIILIPYAIPAFISAVVWRGMFDPNLGIINDMLNLINLDPSWYNGAGEARLAILLIQLWLGFPYMMLVCTGALQAIPSDIYEAAEVDGATAWHRFRYMTLPLLLVTVGPLLIASFAFNFNNFTVIELYNSGGPAIPDSSVPAGFTDILITYTYAQAFGTAGGTDYAFASAISIFIFLIVASITIINFRFTKAWEEISENV